MHPLLNETKLLGHLKDFLSIEGTSGNESRVAHVIEEKLRSFGCPSDFISYDNSHKAMPDQFAIGNLIIRLPGTVKCPTKLFVSHMDTVPLCLGAKPVRKNGYFVAENKTGLGADNRTGVACLVSILEVLLKSKIEYPPLTFLFSIGEEVGLFGARNVDVSLLGHPCMGINIDSGSPEKLIHAAVGADRWEVHVHGCASHAGVHPEDGVSAIFIASLAICEAAKNGYFGKIEKGEFGGSSNIGIIRGGEASNQVTDYVYVKGESRSFHEGFIGEITHAYQKSFENSLKKVRNREGKMGTITFTSHRDYQPFVLDKNEKVSLFTKRIAEKIGLTPYFERVHGGLDANALHAKGIPTITIGAGQHHAHTLREFVDIKEYLTGCRLALELALDLQYAD